MSVLTVQLGQCGLQVGYDLFNTLAQDLGIFGGTSVPSLKKSDYVEDGLERWFYTADEHNKYVARSVLVDTEVKVVKSILKKASVKHWVYNPSNIVCTNFGGSANNWAFGYKDRGPKLLESVSEKIRREVEKCDRFHCFLTILASAGGTGSGVGCTVIEELSNDYPSKLFVNAMVLPYEGGEVITQNYNTVFTFAKLYDYTDVHVIFQNDFMHKMCTKLVKTERVMLEDINLLIADKLSFLHPIRNNSLHSVISDLSPHPGYKLVTVKTAPYVSGLSKLLKPSFDWDVLVKHMVQSLRVSALSDENSMNWELKVPSFSANMQHSVMKYVGCVTNTLVTRGPWSGKPMDPREFQLREMHPNWLPSDLKFHHYHENEQFLGREKFISLVTNSAFICDPLGKIVDKAWTTFCERAYVHHFEKFGLMQEDMSQAFIKLDDILKNYGDLK